MSPDSRRVTVEVDGRRLALSNLDKVLYPDVGFTKGEVINYYTQIAPVLLPHVRDRALTLKRYPDGVEGGLFFQKNRPKGTPEWVQSIELASPGSTKNRDTVDYPLLGDLPTLVWAANLAGLELHVPMWRITQRRDETPYPDLLVFDLDPGAPADIVDCCRVALLVRDVLAENLLSAWPKTSGSKGLQLYVPLDAQRPWEDVHAYAKQTAVRLERENPKLVVSQMRKDIRGGKVLVDWSQNNAAKTTVAVYSLRARPQPTVSTPVTWDEVEQCADGETRLVFTSDEVLHRVADRGDLFAPILDGGQQLP